MERLIVAVTGKNYKVSGGFWNTDPTYPAELKPHIGTDYPLNEGTRLEIPTYVHVTRIGGHADYGTQIWLWDPHRDLTYHFAHLSWLNPEIKVGDGRYHGYHFANSGSTGKGFDGVVISNGVVPHLHLSVAKGKVTDTGKYNHEWLSAETIMIEPLGDVEKPKPQTMSLPAGSRLYDSRGNAYPAPTTVAHNVTIYDTNGGMGLIREGWLQGVSEAWVKLNSTPERPTTDVGRIAQLRGNVYLYDRNGNKYRIPSGRSRDLKILEEVGDMYKVSDSAFDPNVVYIKKNSVKVV